jgi:large subunit ribosomal protein L4
MDIQVTSLDGKDAGSLTLKDEIFGLEPRADILHRMVRYQGLKAMAGTHKAKGRAEIAYTGHKVGKQKGGGVARHGSRRAPQFRGGGRAFGPTPRSHAIELPKQVRALALKHALSAKAKAGELTIVDTLSTKEPKTAALRLQFGQLEWWSALIIDGAELDKNFAMAARNIPQIDVLPIQGINVVDILRRSRLVLTKAAVEALEARFA